MLGSRFSPTVVAATVAAAGAAITVSVVLLPGVRFGYRAAGAHIAVETTAVLIALLVALLALGRFRRNRAVADLLLTATFVLLALVNLLFSTVPAILSDLPDTAATWGALGGRVVGAGLLAAAAVGPDRACRPAEAHGGFWCALAGVLWWRSGWRPPLAGCLCRSTRCRHPRWACPAWTPVR